MSMIKKIIYFVSIFGFGLTGQFIQAQVQSPVVIAPLSSNPKLVQENVNMEKALFPAGSQYYFYDDTLSLPFIDDFSKDKFKDFRLSQYTGVYQDTLHYFKTKGYGIEYPDSIWYVSVKPDSFVITSPDTFEVQEPQGQQFKIYVYDTLSNPYAIADSFFVWQYIPKMVDVVNGVPIYAEDFLPDGMFYNFEKIYTIVPASPATDKSLWIDRHVYVSTGMGVRPPTVGVAVFDGIRMNGMPYNHTPGSRGVADYLTSKPLDLLGYLPGDSLYLSFFIQPQGIGFLPEPKDTFVLEFKSPDNPNWKWIWSKKGTPIDSFKQIMIAIKDPQWLVKGFQFRFKNYANLNANMDHWLLDYVRLDANRSRIDTTINDVAFVTRAPSILRNYEQMPARQFKQEDVNQKWEIKSVNLWNQCKWATYGHTTLDESGTPLTSYPYDDNPASYDTTCINTYFPGRKYNTNPRHNLPTFNYVFDVQDPNCCPYEDSARFTIRHVFQNLTAGPGSGTLTYDTNTGNDTIYRHQTFYNFYAYDDGEAESAMYLGAVGEVASEFELNFPDTLRAIQFYFSPQDPNASGNTFQLRVWKTLQDVGEDTLYSQISVHPAYNDIAPNSFTTYILNRPVVLPAGKFYIGWKQTSNFRMNVGFDKNVDRSDKTFYNTTSEWKSFGDLSSTSYDGSMMMRPVLGKEVTPGEFVDIDEVEITAATVNVFPNPSSGIFHYELSTELPNDLEIQVLDLSGKTVYAKRGGMDRTLDLNHLTDGIYFTRFTSKSIALYSTHKLILSK